jgi:hypothetical protein
MLLSMTSAAAAQAPPLRRDLADYALFAQRAVQVERLFLLDGNLGANCPGTRLPGCGIVQADLTILGAGDGQIAGETVLLSRSESTVSQLFTRQLSVGSRVTIVTPGTEPNGTEVLFPPILDDVDGDNRPSCDDECRPDTGDLKKACGFPPTFPACDPGKPVIATAGSDCSGLDAEPGNARCDLLPGAYGDLQVGFGATLALASGDYAVCNVRIERNGVLGAAAARLLVSDGGLVRAESYATIGGTCTDLDILMDGTSRLLLDTGSTIVGDVCAPEGAIDLGISANVVGRIVGDSIRASGLTMASACSAP